MPTPEESVPKPAELEMDVSEAADEQSTKKMSRRERKKQKKMQKKMEREAGAAIKTEEVMIKTEPEEY